MGNIHSGGSGKTPLVAALARHLDSRSPVVLTRGYLGSLSETGSEVRPEKNNGVALYGDEAWMLAKRFSLNVFVGKNRVRAIQEMESRGKTSLVIMDDGLQHFRLKRDVDLVVLNTERVPKRLIAFPWENCESRCRPWNLRQRLFWSMMGIRKGN